VPDDNTPVWKLMGFAENPIHSIRAMRAVTRDPEEINDPHSLRIPELQRILAESGFERAKAVRRARAIYAARCLAEPPEEKARRIAEDRAWLARGPSLSRRLNLGAEDP
jgi:hypothetical protein